MNLFGIFASWAIVLVVAWSGWTMLRDAVKTTKRMHQIPCTTCQFFTQNYALKCTVHPQIALSEHAIHCPDYCPWHDAQHYS